LGSSPSEPIVEELGEAECATVVWGCLVGLWHARRAFSVARHEPRRVRSSLSGTLAPPTSLSPFWKTQDVKLGGRASRLGVRLFAAAADLGVR
jgi:hypothetical protein